MKRNIHIVKRGPNWVGKEENRNKPILTEKIQKDAIKEVRNILHNNKDGGELFIHGEDGKIRARDTISPAHDPRSSKG